MVNAMDVWVQWIFPTIDAISAYNFGAKWIVAIYLDLWALGNPSGVSSPFPFRDISSLVPFVQVLAPVPDC